MIDQSRVPLKDLMESAGLSAQCFGSAEEFLESDQQNQIACLVADIRMPACQASNCKRS
jgi:FixJ family two-component response regulator